MERITVDVPLLERVKQRILERPHHFDMGTFLREEDCGTVACIAGHIALMQEEEKVKPLGVLHRASSILLRIRLDESYQLWAKGRRVRLFYAFLWPDELKLKHAESEDPKERAEIACEAIDYYIQNQGEILTDAGT